MNSETKIMMTPEDVAELAESAVLKTLSKLGLLATKQSNPRVYRSAIVQIIGRRSFDKAVKEGNLHPVKEDLNLKTAKIWVEREEWERFKKSYVKRVA